MRTTTASTTLPPGTQPHGQTIAAAPPPADQDLSGERSDPHCLPAERLGDLLRTSGWRRLVAVGDSIPAGVGDPHPGYLDRSWADRLAHALAHAHGEVAYLNLGVRELRAAEIRATQLDAALAFEPDLAVVSAGPNDMLRRSFDPAAVAFELEVILGSLTAAGALVVTFGLLDLTRTAFVPDGLRSGLRDRIATLNATTASVTARHGGVHVDLFEHPATDDDLFSADMLHPNRRGHAHIATAVVRALAARLAPGAGA